MPKKVDFPHFHIKNCIAVAQKVKSLGGKANIKMIAESMDQSATSGSFVNKMSSTIKYGLLEGKDELTLTELSKGIITPLSEEEKKENLKKSFLNPPLFKDLFERFKETPIENIKYLTTVLIRKYEIKENLAQKVAFCFLKSGMYVGIIDKTKDGYTFIGNNVKITEVGEEKSSLIKKTPYYSKYIFDTIFSLGELSIAVEATQIKNILERLYNSTNDLQYTHQVVDLILKQFNTSKDVGLAKMSVDNIKETLQKELGIKEINQQ